MKALAKKGGKIALTYLVLGYLCFNVTIRARHFKNVKTISKHNDD